MSHHEVPDAPQEGEERAIADDKQAGDKQGEEGRDLESGRGGGRAIIAAED